MEPNAGNYFILQKTIKFSKMLRVSVMDDRHYKSEVDMQHSLNIFFFMLWGPKWISAYLHCGGMEADISQICK